MRGSQDMVDLPVGFPSGFDVTTVCGCGPGSGFGLPPVDVVDEIIVSRCTKT